MIRLVMKKMNYLMQVNIFTINKVLLSQLFKNNIIKFIIFNIFNVNVNI